MDWFISILEKLVVWLKVRPATKWWKDYVEPGERTKDDARGGIASYTMIPSEWRGRFDTARCKMRLLYKMHSREDPDMPVDKRRKDSSKTPAET